MIWSPRAVPLPAVAAIARGHAAPLLAARLLAMEDEQLSQLRGCATRDLIAIAGPDLPWIDGIEYFGRDDELFLPTAIGPGVPVPLLARAIATRHPELKPPFAIAMNPDLLISFAAMAPTERSRLLGWMETRR